MSEPEWRAVPGFSRYEASSDGDVRSVARSEPMRTRSGAMGSRRYAARVLRPCRHSNGYLTVNIKADEDDAPRHYCVNRLVFAAFVRAPTPDEEVDHRDKVRDHNAPGNLRALSVADNRALRDPMLGEANPASRLTTAEVVAIRAATGSHRLIAARFGVSRSLVSLVRSRRVWAHVA